MRTATAGSSSPCLETAVRTALETLLTRLGATPHLLVVQATVPYPIPELAALLAAALPGVPIHGATSSQALMTDEGLFEGAAGALGLFGLFDPEGSYGVGHGELGEDPAAAAEGALRRALEQAGRPGEVPAVVWLSAAPGQEERVLAGVDRLFAGTAPVFGGSSSDNDIAGHWAQFGNGWSQVDGVVTTVLFPSMAVTSAFQNGYEPSGRGGRLTRSEGRTLVEIDGRPAATVYDELSGGCLGELLRRGGNCLAATTLAPLGEIIDRAGELPLYRLVHPAAVVLPGPALSLFAEVQQGTQLEVMVGESEALIDRAGHVARSALECGQLGPQDVAGGLIVFCAGCLQAVAPDQRHRIVAAVRQALPDVPFLGAFTFGEQGCTLDGRNRHGNLMVSALLFVGSAPASGQAGAPA